MDNSDKQMAFLFEEGGIADDGMNVDPVSGNEVPPGSMAEEVRDDIPAQLSEGEYVVPADVVRYFGVKFFEDLRSEAKMGLGSMEANGRIGGEPMGEMEDDDLTPEEMAEIEGMMMAVGGLATQQQMQQPDPYQQQQMMYNQGTPVAVGNAGYAKGGEVRGYAPGGSVTLGNPAFSNTQASFDWSNFGAGFSFSPQAEQNLANLTEPAEPAFEPVTMYSPTGEEVTANTLEEYTQYLTDGYTLSPPAMAEPSSGGGDSTPTEDTEPKDPTSWAEGLDFTDPEALTKDVYAMIDMSKGEKAGMSAAMSGLGLVGAAGAGVYRATGIARANAIASLIEDAYPDVAEKIRTKVNETVEDSLFLKNLPDEWINGSKILQDLQGSYGSSIMDIAARSMSAEQRRSMSSTGIADTQGGVYKPGGIDVAMGQGDSSDKEWAGARARSRQKAAANRAAMEEAQKATGGTDNISELKEAYEEAGGTWATGGR